MPESATRCLRADRSRQLNATIGGGIHPANATPVTRNKTVIKTQYMFHGQLLETVSQVKYIGVTITSDLRWDAHINSISLKANRSLGFLRRNSQSLVNPNKNSSLVHLYHADLFWETAVLSGTPTQCTDKPCN